MHVCFDVPQSVLPWVGFQASSVPCVTLACAYGCVYVLARLSSVCPGRWWVVPPSDPTAPSLQFVGPLAGAGEQGLRCAVCCLPLAHVLCRVWGAAQEEVSSYVGVCTTCLVAVGARHVVVWRLRSGCVLSTPLAPLCVMRGVANRRRWQWQWQWRRWRRWRCPRCVSAFVLNDRPPFSPVLLQTPSAAPVGWPRLVCDHLNWW